MHRHEYMHQEQQQQVRGNTWPGSSTDMASRRPLPLTRQQLRNEIRFANSLGKGRELEPGSGQRRAVQAQLGLCPGVSSLAPALRNGLTRGVLSLLCPRTPALSHDASPSSTPDSGPAIFLLNLRVFIKE